MHSNNCISRFLQRRNGLVLSLIVWDKESSLFGLINLPVTATVDRTD